MMIGAREKFATMSMNTKLGLGAALLGAFALGVIAVAVTSAQDSSPGGAERPAGANTVGLDAPPPRAPVETSFSDLEEDEIRALVREYLFENPEVIIEAVNEYSRRQQFAAQERAVDGARENLAALLSAEHGYVAGADPAKAKVAVIELFDYHCGFCKRATPLVRSLIEGEDDVKFVFREYPILREESDYAAEIALAARDQGKFLDMHFAMMESSGVLTKDRIEKIAKDVGADFAALEKKRKDPAIAASIFETVAIVDAMGIDGTPAFVVATPDGEYVNVVQGFDPRALSSAIAEARAAAG